MPLFLPKLAPAEQRYDIAKSYEWNYANAPALPETFVMQPADRTWSLCGVEVNSPVAIAAGPLLNGRWVLHYAAIGYDVVTYKTVRSKAWPCYALPNLAPIEATPSFDDRPIKASDAMNGSWAVSFGMPSASPDLWRFDIEETRRLLPSKKKLAVSVVASPDGDWSIDQVAADYAQCAHWARESGADFIELNLSCPNISTTCGDLFRNAEATKQVVESVRTRISDTPLLIKIGHVTEREQVESIVDSLEKADGIVMINCIPMKVERNGELLFEGNRRGIAGPAIRSHVLEQVRLFGDVIRQNEKKLEVIAVGGISSEDDVEACLDVGAAAVQVATSAMI